jgi:hypothetical protein
MEEMKEEKNAKTKHYTFVSAEEGKKKKLNKIVSCQVFDCLFILFVVAVVALRESGFLNWKFSHEKRQCSYPQ